MEINHKSIDYKIYRCLLNQLDRLDELGYNDSPEADIIRDTMDHYWHRLTLEDKSDVRNWSIRLYSLRQ